nr:MFS transporter [Streptomyces sp. DSM 41633]
RILVRADYVTDLLPVMLLAAGFGLALPALTSLGMSGAGEDDAGLASGLFNTTQQIGMALGVAVLTTLAAGRTEALRAAGSPSAEALTGGYRLAFPVGAALLVAAFAVAFLTLRREPTAAAGHRQPHPAAATGRTGAEA